MIGRGGMGVVYEATDRTLKRTVAVKLIDLTESSAWAAERFEEEARIAAGLVHPNIVTVHDYGVDTITDGVAAIQVAFLVMERLSGPDLAGLIRRDGPLPVARALTLIEQAAAGLQAAHTHGIVHCDVKPKNLMLDQHGKVKILDFGIAKLSQTSRTSTQKLVGSLAYMPPERLKGKQATVGGDLYSLGCTLVELLTGRPPFDGADTEILAKIYDDSLEAEPLSSRRPELPAALDQIAGLLIAKDPAKRYPRTAEEVARALAGFRATGSATKRQLTTKVLTDSATLVDLDKSPSARRMPASLTEPLPSPVAGTKPRRARVSKAVVAAMVLVVIGSLAWLLNRGPQIQAAPLQPPASATATGTTPKPSPTSTTLKPTRKPTHTPSPKRTPKPTPRLYTVTWDELEGSSKSYRSFPVGGVPFIYAAGKFAGTTTTFASTTCSRFNVRAAIPDRNDDSAGVLQVSQGQSNPVDVGVRKGSVAKRSIRLKPGEPLIITSTGSSIWWNGDLVCTTADGT